MMILLRVIMCFVAFVADDSLGFSPTIAFQTSIFRKGNIRPVCSTKSLRWTKCSDTTVCAGISSSEEGETAKNLKDEAAILLEKARRIRSEIGAPNSKKAISSTPVASKWSVSASDDDAIGEGYRLYVDVGREDGTWMDPRWAASGNRLEFTLDVKFRDDLADSEIVNKMVKDNFTGERSKVFILDSAGSARLRGGFDSMKCSGGGYRIDTDRRASTARFYIETDGTPERGSTYGDVWVPNGCLYFSLPCFGRRISQLSIKEGPVTVRQVGWHTGWRREESRIIGTFRAVSITDAQLKDGF